MALESETTRSEEPSLESAAMDFIGFRRADRAACARRNFSAGGAATIHRQPGLAAPLASLPFTASRPILNLYAPRRRRDGKLHRSHCFVATSSDALSRRSAVPGVQTLCPPLSPPMPRRSTTNWSASFSHSLPRSRQLHRRDASLHFAQRFCHRSVKNQPAGVESKPATLR